jgi:hypothetical protein
MSKGAGSVFVKRTKVSDRFTVLSNNVFADNRLSWAALGLLGYLLHHKEDFEFKLYNLGKLRKGLSGRHATRSAMAELEKVGYVRIERTRNEKGHYGATFWYVTDEPAFDLPKTENPETENPNVAKPFSEQP